MNPEHYCLRLHAGLNITLNGWGDAITVDPCTAIPFGFSSQDDDLFNHPGLIDARNKNKETGKLWYRCATCHVDEIEGRIGAYKSSGNVLIDPNKMYDFTGPRFITFQLDNSCNLACVTCGPALSTKWRLEENVKGRIKLSEDNTRQMIRSLDKSNLTHVHIYGGEPLLSTLHKVILEELLDRAPHITLEIDTNGTQKVREDILKMWEKFQIVKLKFSLDGTEKVFEYLRWPATWREVTDTVRWYQSNIRGNYALSLRPAIGFLNIHKMDDLIRWHKDNLATNSNKSGNPSVFSYNGVYGLYTAQHMSKPMIDDARELYRRDPRMNKLIPNDVCADVDQKLAMIRDNLDALSAKRGLDWQECLPHLVKYLP